jgi:diguanylate cyclase
MVTRMQNEHERTLSFAELALGQIRSLGQSAVPRNYEVWYVYAAGYNAPLNKIINETLAHGGKLTDSDFDQIYDTYLSHSRHSDRIDQVGARFVGEIDDLAAVVSEALGLTTKFGNSLEGASNNLKSGPQDIDQVKSVVEMLLSAAKSMKAANQHLEQRLNNSRLEISSLQQNLEAIRAESLTDPLTGLANRKMFDRALTMSINSARANNEPMALLMLDIDHFKSFNDNYGHLTGDQVLRLVGISLRQTMKGQDTIARYGGEEFAVVLPNTSLQQAVVVGDHIRRAVMSRELKKKSTGEILGRVTISIGAAALTPSDDTFSIIDRADSCLYAAKRGGRNRVVSELDADYIADTAARVA